MMTLYYRKAIEDIRSNRFLAVVTTLTIALSVLMAGTFSLLIVNAQDIMAQWKDGIRIMVYLAPELDGNRQQQIGQEIRRMSGVKAATFISKAEAMDTLRSQMEHQSAILDNLRTNPLPDAYLVQMDPAHQRLDSIENLATALEAVAGVADVEYGQQWLSRFIQVFDVAALVGYAMAGLFFMAAVFFVANTIRLVIYSRRDEIDIMRLVGAEDRLITMPLYIEGMILGLLGGAVGLGVLGLAFWGVSVRLDTGLAAGLFHARFLPPTAMGVVVVSSMAVGLLGCLVSLKQHLRI